MNAEPVDVLANEIRRLGVMRTSLGAGRMAEALMPFIDSEFIRRDTMTELFDACKTVLTVCDIERLLELDLRDALTQCGVTL